MVTIEDIAREAGVSATTVSNVIHGRTNKVSSYTVDLINEIIRERGYVPSLSARAMRTRSSKVVALINHLESRYQQKFMSDPFFMDLTGAVEKALRERGYFLMIRAISDPEELTAFLRNWNVEGLFMPGLFENEPFYETLRGLKLPVVLTDSYVSDLGNMVNIGLEDFEGARLAVDYLAKLGHKRIVFAGPAVKPGGVVEQRLLGYRRALAQNGVEFDPSLVFECEFSTGKMTALGESLATRKDITAVFATADMLAAASSGRAWSTSAAPIPRPPAGPGRSSPKALPAWKQRRGSLFFTPNCQKKWKRVRFTCQVGGETYRVTVTHEKGEIEKLCANTKA